MTISVKEYLKKQVEEMPKWLENYKKGDKININEVLSSRVVYYPGAFIDGQPIRTFNSSKFAHVFVYVDFGAVEDRMVEELSTMKGYKVYDVVKLKESDLTPNGWRQHLSPSETADAVRRMEEYSRMGIEKSFAFLAIFEREEEYGEDHGSKRFALLYICGDGFATYDALFLNNNISPSVVVTVDHGFSCFYDSFCRGGLLEKLATRGNSMPTFLMCERDEWNGYEKVEDVLPEASHNISYRYLYKINK